MTAADDFSITANAGQRLKPDRLPDGHPTGDGLVPIADRRALFKADGEADLVIGTDGDDIGRPARDQAIGDMLDSGHGFLTREMPQPKTTGLTSCEICGGPLPTPGEDPEWLCQYYDQTRPASLECNCPWCLTYQAYMAGWYKPRGGRPRQRCGSKACDRKADAQRKAKKRLWARREKLFSLPNPDPQGPDLTLGDLPPEIREQVRAKLRVDFEPSVWNRKRGRNEPNWWLSGQRKRGLWSPVRKTP
jgi:hypothetical protein